MSPRRSRGNWGSILPAAPHDAASREPRLLCLCGLPLRPRFRQDDHHRHRRLGLRRRVGLALSRRERDAEASLQLNGSLADSLGVFYLRPSARRRGLDDPQHRGRYMGAVAWGDREDRLTNPYYRRHRQILHFESRGGSSSTGGSRTGRTLGHRTLLRRPDRDDRSAGSPRADVEPRRDPERGQRPALEHAVAGRPGRPPRRWCLKTPCSASSIPSSALTGERPAGPVEEDGAFRTAS